MTIKKLIADFGLEVFSDGKESEIEKFYIGDLLSWVMGKAERNCCWLTIMSNVNVAAVAALIECGCVVLCESVRPDQALKDKMQELGIYLLGTGMTTFEFAQKFALTGKRCL